MSYLSCNRTEWELQQLDEGRDDVGASMPAVFREWRPAIEALRAKWGAAELRAVVRKAFSYAGGETGTEAWPELSALASEILDDGATPGEWCRNDCLRLIAYGRG